MIFRCIVGRRDADTRTGCRVLGWRPRRSAAAVSHPRWPVRLPTGCGLSECRVPRPTARAPQTSETFRRRTIPPSKRYGSSARFRRTARCPVRPPSRWPLANASAFCAALFAGSTPNCRMDFSNRLYLDIGRLCRLSVRYDACTRRSRYGAPSGSPKKAGAAKTAIAPGRTCLWHGGFPSRSQVGR